MESTPIDQRTTLLGRLIARHHDQLISGAVRRSRRRHVEHSGLLGGHDPDVGAALDAELRHVLGDDGLAELGTLSDAELITRVTERLAASPAPHREVLWALAGGDDRLLEGEQGPET